VAKKERGRIMNLSEAIKVFSKYWPCTHGSYELIGDIIWGIADFVKVLMHT
jgi:hypothetical protein